MGSGRLEGHVAFLGSIVIKLSSISAEDLRPKCQSGTRKETLHAILSRYDFDHDDTENKHLLCSCSNVKVGLGRSTVRMVAGRGDEGLRKAEVRQQKPSRLPNFRQLFSGVDPAPINTVPVTLHRRGICLRTRFPGTRTK